MISSKKKIRKRMNKHVEQFQEAYYQKFLNEMVQYDFILCSQIKPRLIFTDFHATIIRIMFADFFDGQFVVFFFFFFIFFLRTHLTTLSVNHPIESPIERSAKSSRFSLACTVYIRLYFTIRQISGFVYVVVVLQRDLNPVGDVVTNQPRSAAKVSFSFQYQWFLVL